MASEDSPDSSIPETLLLYSLKSPEEARIFGFRGSDIQDIRPPQEEKTPVSPEQWGFTSPNADGICQYCQLLLHPDVPSFISHQPNLQSLVESGETCSVCKWLEISLTRGSPWLVARYQQGDPALCDRNSTEAPVCIELTKNEKYTSAVAIVGKTAFPVNNGQPLTITTPSRLGKNWLKDCENHETCLASLPQRHNVKLPTRVLDLTGSPDVPSTLEDVVIKLKECREGELGTYTALSYCWGTEPDFHFKTTTENLDKHKQSIDFASLPLTQREAILATLYLGIRYLWIDSVCIVQDSAHDWEVESAQMGSVYANACLTLAATSSDSPKEGLLNPFQGAQCVKIHGETAMIRMETHRTIDKASEPLNTRGWTLQEAVLASRLVCFGREQWLWKCPARYATEDGLIDGPWLIDNGPMQWAVLTNQGPGKDGKDYLKYWYQLITNYSKRRLAYSSDKRNAIAGLAGMFAKQTGHQYLAGLWAEDLANGLVWEATSRGVVREPGSVPSWSWTSVVGEIKAHAYNEESSRAMLELLKVDQQWEGIELASPLKAARLTVKGLMLKTTLGKRAMTQELRHHIIAAPGSEEILGEAFLDSKLLDGDDVSTIWCLITHEMTKASQKGEYVALLLVSTSGKLGEGEAAAYRRFGIGILWENSKIGPDGNEGGHTIARASSASVVLV
ncbi:heterokaryon incompatibility protein-domain-containing protein [Stachybotrys elegans]|uniref:Heterokaryon incompatibility protein-domain-containing protein n=1 Tax=Stachybotrys elegans TaxID=80388 RepID=A0A8K0SLY8_9HYPO|nr:heterokaryon incompatibility protein-domain-containing protein [Stachybotrys elegans]